MDELIEARNKSILSLSKPWIKFFDKFKQIDILNIEQWEPIHILAYFDRRYREVYNKNYAFTFKGAPSKCSEIVMIKKVCASLWSVFSVNDFEKAKHYIEWIFNEKTGCGKIKIRSISFLMTAGFVNEFADFYKKKFKPSRSMELPSRFMNIVKQYGGEFNTYGDLAFALVIVKSDIVSDKKEKYQEMFDQLVMLGFKYRDIEGIV